MKRTRRAPSTSPAPPGPGPRSGVSTDPQDLLGNSALAEQLPAVAGIDAHNAIPGDGHTVDPEAVSGSTALAPGERWDGRAILDRWSQLDGSSSTRSEIDSRRCGAQAVLAPHVLAGPQAIAAVASAAARRIPRIHDETARLMAEGHANALRTLSRTSSLQHWDFSDLDELAETLYLIANEGTTFEGEGGTATSTDELARITELGVPEGSEEARGGLGGVLDSLGLGQLSPELPGTRAVTGRASIEDLPDSGQHNGTSRLEPLVGRLRLHRNAALIIGTAGPQTRNPDGSQRTPELFPEPVPESEAPSVLGSREMDALAGIEHNRIAHGVTLGVDDRGEVYLYDPWPREGAQRLAWPDRQIQEYFTGDWVIMARVAAAAGARRPGVDG